MRHQVQWAAPAPMWGRAPDLAETGRVALRRPAILRFASDTFMDEFHRTLETDPSKLASLEAQYETWRGPGVSTPAVPEPVRGASRLEQKLTRLRVSADRRLVMFGASGSAGAGAALAERPVTVSPAIGSKTSAPPTLKLYQPAHQRFYLVTAALVCRLPGLPDREINATRQEKTAFVLRRLRTFVSNGVTTRFEYGFIAKSNGGVWQRVETPDTALAPGEEKMPLFAVNFQDDASQKRRVLAALIPAGRREVYVGAPDQTTPQAKAIDQGTGDTSDPGAPGPPLDARIALLSADVIEPWKALVQLAAKTKADIADPNNTGPDDPDPTKTTRKQARDSYRKASRENIQVGSWYVLLDLATFLETQLKDVWDAITKNTTPPEQAQRDVVAAIAGASLPPNLQAALAVASTGRSVKPTLKEALTAVADFREKLERVTGDAFTTPLNSDWPNFLFPLADAEFGGAAPAVTPAAPAGPTLSDTQKILRKISGLRNLIAAALPATPTAAVPDLPLAAQPVMEPDVTARFIIRCVFDRPECGPIDPPLLSAPSREFELASFFDPDAPARPIRISLPMDTSPAGFRRAPKNTAFMISDLLCGQINRAKGLGFVDLVLSVLPWPFHKDLPTTGTGPCTTDTGASLGMICSLSIPIITICALILLIIIVTLLDIIFHWIPYFIVCFPLPKFSAKPPQP